MNLSYRYIFAVAFTIFPFLQTRPENIYTPHQSRNIHTQSTGTLSFKCNGKLFTADASHARGYAVATTKVGYVNGANMADMVLNLEMPGLTKKGSTILINPNKDKCAITLNHNNYFIKEPGDFMEVTITSVKQEGQLLLLAGNFSGKLHDLKGNEAIISEGIFSTDRL